MHSLLIGEGYRLPTFRFSLSLSDRELYWEKASTLSHRLPTELNQFHLTQFDLKSVHFFFLCHAALCWALYMCCLCVFVCTHLTVFTSSQCWHDCVCMWVLTFCICNVLLYAAYVLSNWWMCFVISKSVILLHLIVFLCCRVLSSLHHLTYALRWIKQNSVVIMNNKDVK